MLRRACIATVSQWKNNVAPVLVKGKPQQATLVKLGRALHKAVDSKPQLATHLTQGGE